MYTTLVISAILGVATTAAAFATNRRLFARDGAAGRVSLLEGIYYVVGLCSLGLGWYFNVRYTHLYGHRATYVNFTKMLFSNWAADSAAQDYIIVNVVLLPLWTISRGATARAEPGVDLLRHEPLHQPRLLGGDVPGVHGAPAAL